ncbi:hypothetical protein SG09_56440 [Bradyrhizobium ottawaense]|nr:hypothetical protein SG09_56440 [Bradyrhizobium ottawaense]BBO12565.1 hypothetical protein TM102_40350 [Bradyrhizobium sp. TM102]
MPDRRKEDGNNSQLMDECMLVWRGRGAIREAENYGSDDAEAVVELLIRGARKSELDQQG